MDEIDVIDNVMNVIINVDVEIVKNNGINIIGVVVF